MTSIQASIEAKNLAIFGASRNPFKPGAMLIDVLRNTGFQGRVAGVNPQGGEFNGVTFYPRVGDVPFDVDLAVMLIPPRAVPSAVAECAAKGVKGVVISSEGFAEAGPEGKVYQDEIHKVLKDTGMRGFGPNTLGLINTETGLTTSYFVNESMLKPGDIGLAAQSGIFVGALLRYLSSVEGLRISKGLGLGNKVDVDECDALEYLGRDEKTRLIGMYLEDIRDGRSFLTAAREASARKPVLILKGGRTSAGSAAVASHTASLAVDDGVLDGALRQTGVRRMDSVEEMMGSLMGFGWMPLPKGRNLALVTYSGAQAIMSIDLATDLGLNVPRFSPKTRERLGRVIATDGKMRNPIDIFPDMMTHGFETTSREILEALLADDDIHGIIFISFVFLSGDVYQPLVDLIDSQRTKPIFFTLMGDRNETRNAQDYMLSRRIPTFLFPEMGVRVFAHMARYAEHRRRQEAGA